MDTPNNQPTKAELMAEENNLSPEINQAYINIVGEEYATANDAEEAYYGKFQSDEDFARDMAEEIEAIFVREVVKWPHYCIDWEYAARELMYDYSEDNGYYFRNL